MAQLNRDLNISKEMDLANFSYNNNEDVKAEKLLVTVLQKDSANCEALNLLGKIYANRGKYDQAKLFYYKCLGVNSQSKTSLFDLAKISFYETDLPKAENYFLEYLNHSGPEIEVLDYLGQIAIARGDIDKIEHYYSIVLNLDSTNVFALNTLGTIYLQQNRVDEAKRFFEKVITLYPDNETGHINLGILYGLNENLQLAEIHFSDAAKIDSSNSEIYYSLGSFYLKYEYYDKAASAFINALNLNPLNTDARKGLVLSYQYLGLIDNAYEEIELLVIQNPGDPEVLLLAADIYRSKGEFKKSVSFANKAIDVDSLFVDGYLFIADMLEEKGLLNEAKKYREKYEALKIEIEF